MSLKIINIQIVLKNESLDAAEDMNTFNDALIYTNYWQHVRLLEVGGKGDIKVNSKDWGIGSLLIPNIYYMPLNNNIDMPLKRIFNMQHVIKKKVIERIKGMMRIMA